MGPVCGLPAHSIPNLATTHPMHLATMPRQASPFRVTLLQEGEIEPQGADAEMSDLAPVPEQGAMSGAAQSCGKGYAQKSCDVKGCGCVGDCCCGRCCVRVYGEFLSLRARDAEVVYAVEANSNNFGLLGPKYPIQVSPTGVLDQDYSSGFRFGFGIGLDPCSEIGASYTWFDSATNHTLSRDPGTPITAVVPMSQHPATLDAITSTVAATGRHDISFDLIDLDYRRLLRQDCVSDVILLMGLRWGEMQQAYLAEYTDDPEQPIFDSNVTTDIDFRGVGIRLGLEAERRACLIHIPTLCYIKGLASLMVGEFDATYQQLGQNNSVNVVDTGWTAGRIVPTFDLELGVGLTTPGGCLRGTLGYLFSSWGNMVKTEDWIRGVQTNNFRDMGDTMTFDGLVGRVEWRF